jgi:magnesium-transporting ATPase (P-type)
MPIPEGITNVDFHDRQFFQSLRENEWEGELFHMLVSLSLCHNVIIEEDEQGHQKYNASSPDELAFINMAKLCGW